MSYQSWDKDYVNSNSWGKWKALKLGTVAKDSLLGSSPVSSAKNKVCLDIGCNEGFFCHKLIEIGAKQVDGIDYNSVFINRGIKRLTTEKLDKIKLQTFDWKNLSKIGKTYDLVLLLSAFHYATSPEWFNKDGTNKLLKDIYSILNPGGILVWEGGIHPGETEEWVKVKRSRDVVYHPTKKAFENALLKLGFKFVFVGPSVNQAGDKIDRFVYHITKV